MLDALQLCARLQGAESTSTLLMKAPTEGVLLFFEFGFSDLLKIDKQKNHIEEQRK